MQTPIQYTAAVAALLQIARGRRRWSAESAAKHAGMAHSTWRRVEDGFTVQARTYAAIETALDLPPGTLTTALADANGVVELARRLDVDTSVVTEGRQSAEEFAATYSRVDTSNRRRPLP